MYKKTGRYSFLIRPIIAFLDILIINVLGIYMINFKYYETYYFHFYITIFWIALAYIYKYYDVYRFTQPLKIFSLTAKQVLSFTVSIFAFWGLFKINYIGKTATCLLAIYVFILITSKNYLFFFALKKYRSFFGGNIRAVIIFGSNQAIQLEEFFKKRKDLGYNLKGVFDNNKNNFSKGISLVNNNEVDEIYCEVESTTQDQLNELLKLSENQNLSIKFISNMTNLFAQKMHVDYYGYFPVMSFQEVTINQPINKLLKRIFDLIFSLFVLVLVLSWLTPILAILIKLESKGPIFFKHTRNGINYKEFNCFKFRSLKGKQKLEFNQVVKNDKRHTKIGRFLRKTSVDELPQFYNVLIGNMSVVGPRPHMLSYTKEYAKKIDKYSYMFRHSVKPGITGLAQVNGYRGEIKDDDDIIGRVKYDIFYIENWSLLLDLRIIIQTIIKAIKGDEKAY